MDIDRLRYLAVVVRAGGFRRAADLLRLSPAALSKAMGLLAREAGVELFVPQGRGVEPTAAARRLAERAEAILREIERLPTEAAAAAVPEGGPVRVGSFEVFTTYFLGKWLSDPTLARANWVIHELVPGELEEALADRKVDLGLTYLPIPHSVVEAQKVARIGMAVFGKRETVADLPFESWPFAAPVTPVTGSPNRVRGLDGWPEDRRRRSVRYRVTLLETALDLCRRGLAVAYLPRFVARLHNEVANAGARLAELASPTPIPRSPTDVFLLRRRGEPETPWARKLARAARLYCRDEPA